MAIKKLKEEEFWRIIFITIPTMVMMIYSEKITEEESLVVLNGALLSAIGAGIGFGIYFFCRKSRRTYKIISLTTLIIVSTIVLNSLKNNNVTLENEETVELNWITQKIGHIEFDSPEKLELKTNNIPVEIKWFYKDIEVYTNNQENQITTFYKAEVKVDTFKIEDAFSALLESMLTNVGASIEFLEFQEYETYPDCISLMFSVPLKGKKVNGYGFMHKAEQNLESIWLIPITKGYSEDYIDEFEAGILLD